MKTFASLALLSIWLAWPQAAQACDLAVQAVVVGQPVFAQPVVVVQPFRSFTAFSAFPQVVAVRQRPVFVRQRQQVIIQQRGLFGLRERIIIR